jgi:hypothetical protein
MLWSFLVHYSLESISEPQPRSPTHKDPEELAILRHSEPSWKSFMSHKSAHYVWRMREQGEQPQITWSKVTSANPTCSLCNFYIMTYHIFAISGSVATIYFIFSAKCQKLLLETSLNKKKPTKTPLRNHQRHLRLLGWRSGEPRSYTTLQEGRVLKIDT